MVVLGLALILLLEYSVSGSGEAGKFQTFHCDHHACNPPVGNLATGRTPITFTTCGESGTELSCSYLDQPPFPSTTLNCGHLQCTKCNAQQPNNSHPPSSMTDDVFSSPNTWWQSAPGISREEIRLDFETEFYLTHVIVVFKSPRPAAMILERSQDGGRTWRPYKYFATNCTATFGLQDDLIEEGSLCTSRYSDSIPCTRGEVHGTCVCRHHTAGLHCEKCLPLYNDQPWKPGDGKTSQPNECKKCRCHNHADSCHFDGGVWLNSGKRTGGICDNCQHHTEGRHCQKCKAGFYRDWSKPMSSPEVCKPCSCQPLGSANETSHKGFPCHPKTGYCLCKPGVAGPHCDRCLVGYWGFGGNGCRPCNCSGECDPHTGACLTGHEKEPFLHVPIGGQIPDLVQGPGSDSEEPLRWDGQERGFSALRHPEKCVCKEKAVGKVRDFCQMKYAYVIKAKILSAYDKGTHAEVWVKVKKILKSGQVKISRSHQSIYPESWTHRGCTCPILNPGTDYLVAGQEDPRSSKLLVNMNSLVKPWKVYLGKQVAGILRTGCK
ncbi:netrin-4-like isoform X2 [Dromiciops gliroides]|uniref:netrin-4-like isoform X2 n=1 Tax=Dromiciops gliroides TaxID=33562 RepID=UPI001CC3DF97|nr:netrin-4-like isoform X2 [Dromiciops gliroides]